MDPLIVATGSPVPLEVALRRALRAAQFAVALPLTAWLLWTQAWWLLPLPLAGGVLLVELLLMTRGDTPTRLALDAEGLELQDEQRSSTLRVRFADVEVATTSWRRGKGGSDAVVLLAGAGGPLAAIRFRLPTVPTREVGDVDLDVIDLLLGGQEAVVRAIAPFEAVARQHFEDPRAHALLRRSVPAAAWGRVGLRTWLGEEPPLDPFGYHLGEPEGWLVVDGERFSLRRYGTGDLLTEGPVSGLALAARDREASLILKQGEAPELVRVPLLGVRLGPDGPWVWIPAPTGTAHAEPREAAATDRHTHPPEGAALVWHLLRTLPPELVPEALRRGLAERRVPVAHLPGRLEPVPRVSLPPTPA